MTTPISPDSSDSSPRPPSVPEGAQPPAFNVPAQNLDPTGAWTRFFQSINHGQPVTPEEVKAFQAGLTKWFSLLIAHENKVWKEANERLKRSIKGE